MLHLSPSFILIQGHCVQFSRQSDTLHERLTWIHFLVTSDAIRIINDLKCTRKLVDMMIGRQLISQDRMQQRRHLTAGQLLQFLHTDMYHIMYNRYIKVSISTVHTQLSKVTGHSSMQQASPLWELRCSETSHMAEVTFQPIPQTKLLLDLATPDRCKAELT